MDTRTKARTYARRPARGQVEFSSTSRGSALSEAVRTDGVALLKRVIGLCMRALQEVNISTTSPAIPRHFQTQHNAIAKPHLTLMARRVSPATHPPLLHHITTPPPQLHLHLASLSALQLHHCVSVSIPSPNPSIKSTRLNSTQFDQSARPLQQEALQRVGGAAPDAAATPSVGAPQPLKVESGEAGKTTQIARCDTVYVPPTDY